jgi:ABC-type multidrug transport system ATPase subunit
MIRTDRLSLRYRGKPAFVDVSLEVPRGSITALVGPSRARRSPGRSASTAPR